MNSLTLKPPEKTGLMAMYGGNIVRTKANGGPDKPKRMAALSPDRKAEAEEILQVAKRISDTPFTMRMLVSHPDLAKYRQSRTMFTARYLVSVGKILPVGRDMRPYQAHYIGLKPVIYRHADCVLAHEKGFDPNAGEYENEGIRQAKDWPAPALAKRLPIECIWPRVIGVAAPAKLEGKANTKANTKPLQTASH